MLFKHLPYIFSYFLIKYVYTKLKLRHAMLQYTHVHGILTLKTFGCNWDNNSVSVSYPPPYFEAKYCLFCGRRRVAVARYRMICLVPIAAKLSN